MTNTSQPTVKTDFLPRLSGEQILSVRFESDIERSKVPLQTTFAMKPSDKEKLWSISTQDGRAKVFRNNVPLKSSNNGQEYGFLLGVEVKVQSGRKMIQVSNNFKCIFLSHFTLKH